MLTVNWVKCHTNVWCSFDQLELSKVKEIGVYIIWYEGNPGSVIRIGQGDVAARIGVHRNDSAVTAYRTSGTLRVTWASVPAAQRNGVEKFLADHYRPLIGDAFPAVPAIAVNLP
jgi:hypothetical protein